MLYVLQLGKQLCDFFCGLSNLLVFQMLLNVGVFEDARFTLLCLGHDI